MATQNTDFRPRFEHIVLFVLDDVRGMTREDIESALRRRKYPLTQSSLSRWTSAGERSDATPWGAAIRTEAIQGEERHGRPKPGRKPQLLYLTPAGKKYREEVVRPFYAALLG